MRAGIVYIKLPTNEIICDLPTESVKDLRESIRDFGMLEPIGVVRQQDRYKLIYGKCRLKACIELGYKYIHAVLLTVREDEERLFSAIENLRRRDITINDLYTYSQVLSPDRLLNLPEKTIKEIKSYASLSSEARRAVNECTRQYLEAAEGDSAYFLRMCEANKNVCNEAKDKVRLSVLSDKRIFINELEKIVRLMCIGGFGDLVYEDDDVITVRKTDIPHSENKAVGQ